MLPIIIYYLLDISTFCPGLFILPQHPHLPHCLINLQLHTFASSVSFLKTFWICCFLPLNNSLTQIVGFTDSFYKQAAKEGMQHQTYHRKYLQHFPLNFLSFVCLWLYPCYIILSSPVLCPAPPISLFLEQSTCALLNGVSWEIPGSISLRKWLKTSIQLRSSS